MIAHPTFRVHFHDEVSLDITAADARAAEAQAKKARPGNYIRKIKILRIKVSEGASQ